MQIPYAECLIANDIVSGVEVQSKECLPEFGADRFFTRIDGSDGIVDSVAAGGQHHGSAADCQDGGEHPRETLFHYFISWLFEYFICI